MQLFIDMIKGSGFLAGSQMSGNEDDRFSQRLNMIGQRDSMIVRRGQVFKRRPKLTAA
jgi:hypothetical protein